MKIAPWRPAFLFAGIALMVGGPRHPAPRPELPFSESTALMLAHPDWVPSHLLMLAAFCFLLTALLIWQRRAHPPASRRWTRFALFAVALAVLEMAFHTAAGIDLERLRAGSATPILTTHLTLAAIANPLLAVGLAAVALQGARFRQLGSRWIVWLVVLGSTLFGFASMYVVLTHDQRVSPLFAIGAALMALWFLAVAFWPVRGSDPREGAAIPTSTDR